MDMTTAVMALLGGILLILIAIRLLIQKHRLLAGSTKIEGKIVGFSGKHTIYKFVYDGKPYTAGSLQRTGSKSKRMNTVEQVHFNPKMPASVVISGNRNVEVNAVFMALFGTLAIAGSILTLF